MSQPYTCATCRFRLLVSKKAVAQLPQRQWSSKPLQTASDAIAAETHGQRKITRPRYSRTLHDPTATTTSNSFLDRGSSSQVLRPADVLGELANTTALDSSPKSSTSDLLETFEQFRRTYKRDDKALWGTLQHLLTIIRTTEDLQILGKNRAWLTGAVWYFTLKTTKIWLENLRGTSIAERRGIQWGSSVTWTPTNPPPGPAVLMSAGNALTAGIVRANWARILWEVSSSLLDLIATKEIAEHRGAIMIGMRELLSLWNQSMRLGILGRSSNATTKPLSLICDKDFLEERSIDWTFLPESTAFSHMLHRENRTDFANTLDLLVPPFTPRAPASLDHNGSLSSVEPFDNVSSALTTLHLLRSIPDDHGLPLSKGKQFGPWANLIQQILRTAHVVNNPPGLSYKTGRVITPAVKAAYDAVFETVALVCSEKLDTSDGQSVDQDVTSWQGITTDPGTVAVGGSTHHSPASPSHQKKPFFRQNSVEQFVKGIQKRLGRASEAQDFPYAQKIYAEVLEFQRNNPAVTIPLTLYESLIITFYTLRNAKTAVSVWEQLISSSQRPTTKTFTLMLQVAQRVRDIDALVNIWHMMRRNSVQPDTHAWSVLIYGLFRSGRDEAGLQALEEVAREWLLAAKAAPKAASNTRQENGLEGPPSDIASRDDGDVNGVVRPNVVVMNSAVSSLAGKSDHLIPKVLGWGRSLGIEPDITTYNVLLNLSMRHSLPSQSANILQQMSERGIEPNSSTWTVLLTGMFEAGSWSRLGPEEQRDHVLNFINGMNSANNDQISSETKPLKIDQKGYALMIDRLLKRYNNPLAAQAVLDHMESVGVQPNVHIYTILMTAYFQHSPPDFEAAEALWHSIQSRQNGFGEVMDKVFYDRMIEGYAQYHEKLGTSALMLQFLERMKSEGKKPSWRALNLAARCLIDRGEWNQLSKVVSDARTRLNEAAQYSEGIRDDSISTGKRDFIRTVLESGILAEEEVTSLKQSLSPATVLQPKLVVD